MRFADESPDAILERQHTELYAAVPNKLGYLGYGSQRGSAVISAREAYSVAASSL